MTLTFIILATIILDLQSKLCITLQKHYAIQKCNTNASKSDRVFGHK